MPRTIQITTRKRSKYGNRRTTIAGKTFDSKKEAHRYAELKLLQEKKHIQNLSTQIRFPLHVNGVLICTYIADFVFYDMKGNRYIEDVKGFRTKEYKLKKKLMLAIHNIEILEK